MEKGKDEGAREERERKREMRQNIFQAWDNIQVGGMGQAHNLETFSEK